MASKRESNDNALNGLSQDLINLQDKSLSFSTSAMNRKHDPQVSSFSLNLIDDVNGSGSSRFSSLQDTESLKSAMLDSFRAHWLQAWSIMQERQQQQQQHAEGCVTRDDVTTIVNHLEQMISLLGEQSSSSSNSNLDSRGCPSLASATKTSSTDPIGSMEDPLSTESVAPHSLGSSLLVFMCDECLLEKIFHWCERFSGPWKAAMYLEQLKIYELLSYIGSNQLASPLLLFERQSFQRPLLQLLLSLAHSDDLLSEPSLMEVEKRLVLLLSTLCDLIYQYPKLLEVFLVIHQGDGSNSLNESLSNESVVDEARSKLTQDTSTLLVCPIDDSSQVKLNDSPSASASANDSNVSTIMPSPCNDPNQFTFPIFLLLTKFVHRDGAIGQQARDALLLCLGQSRHDDRLAYYVVTRTIFCPVLAEGLSGRFSTLPRVIIGRSMSVEQFQLKDELLHNSSEIEAFLRLLEFCNAVVQISHPIVQRLLLNLIYNGFLVSVIGPALHQNVADVSIQDLETLSAHSNTLDEIITKTAYLDLFLRSISEKNLIRIFLEFLCFGTYENENVLKTLISRIAAKSKLSLITLILFGTLLDLNCEDLHFELIYKFLMRGQHLNMDDAPPPMPVNDSEANWLSASGLKLFSMSLSHYLYRSSGDQHLVATEATNLYNPLQAMDDFSDNHHHHHHHHHLHNFYEYLVDAQLNIEQCRRTTQHWRNSFDDYCIQLNLVADESIVFCVDENEIEPEWCEPAAKQQSLWTATQETIDLANLTPESINLTLPSLKQRRLKTTDLSHFASIEFDEQTNRIRYAQDNASNTLPNCKGSGGQPGTGSGAMHVGLFLHTLLERLEKFYENDILTNLHLTGLLARLCHYPHQLLLQFLFDPNLGRAKGVPCLMQILQRLSFDSQSYCDQIDHFEITFASAKANLQSMPIGEIDCKLLTSGYHQHHNASDDHLDSASHISQASTQTNIKAFKSIKNFLFGGSKSSSKSSSSSTSMALSRRSSNASLASSASQMLEIIPNGVRFLNQLKFKDHSAKNENQLDKQSELIYNLIIFDEFLLELAATLAEQELQLVRLAE